MVAIGVLVSTLVQGGSAALGVSISVWFCMVFLGDLGLMGAAVATRLPAETLFTAALLNPIEAFRLATVMSLEGSLDALGPAGTYAVDTFGRGVTVLAILVLGLWTAVALGLSAHVFKRRDQA
jgi:ABC-type transport system involved in multi-copper enzyme maturation permease subunit